MFTCQAYDYKRVEQSISNCKLTYIMKEGNTQKQKRDR